MGLKSQQYERMREKGRKDISQVEISSLHGNWRGELNGKIYSSISTTTADIPVQKGSPEGRTTE